MSFPRYANYKDSHVDLLGEVPSHWPLVRLKHVASLKGRLGWQGLRADEYTDNGPYLVTSEHFANERVDWDRCYHVSANRYNQAPEIQLRPDDLLMMKDGAAMGKLAYVESVPGEACLNSHLLLFRPMRERFHNRFLFYILGGPSFNTYMVQTRTGTTFFGISQESIGLFPMALPSADEQKLIVAFLDRETAKIDALIAEQERLIELLKEKRQAVISHAVTKGLDRYTQMKESGIDWLGKIPRAWELKRLGLLCDAIQTRPFGSQLHSEDYVEGGTPVINPSNISCGEISPDWSCTVNGAIVERLRQHKLKEGDIVFARRGEMGRCAKVSEKEAGWLCGTGCLNVRLGGSILPDFVAQYLSTAAIRELLQLESVGSTMDNLNTFILSRIPILVPPIDQQREIMAAIHTAAQRIDALTAEAARGISLLQERRTSLISSAVTGKIDVRGLASAQPEKDAAA